jgi:hypothetical protein
MDHPDDLHADELQSVVDQLRAHRPEASALELDAIKRRVRGRVAKRPAGRRARSASLMKSRLAILTMLVSGILLSTTGVGLAIDGASSQNNAAVAQYATPTPTPTGGGGVLGEDTGNSPGGSKNQNHNTPGGTHAENSGGVQPARQVEAGAGSNTLPFTGFLAIPVLLGGVFLLSAGLVLRRKAAHDE